MESRVDDAWSYLVSESCAQDRVAGAARESHPVALFDPAHLRIVRMDVEDILGMPFGVFRAPGLRADVVLRQRASGGQDEREAAGGALARRHVLSDEEFALAAHELPDMHRGRALGSCGIAGPLDAAEAVKLGIADAGESGRQRRNLIHDLRRVRVVHRIAERIG